MSEINIQGLGTVKLPESIQGEDFVAVEKLINNIANASHHSGFETGLKAGVSFVVNKNASVSVAGLTAEAFEHVQKKLNEEQSNEGEQ